MAAIGALVTSACGGSTPVETEATTSATGTPTSTATASPTPTDPHSPTPTSSATSSSGGTSSPTPTPSDPLDRASLTLDPSGHRFTATPVTVPRNRASGACPIPPPRNATITACATANAAGGTVGVTVEENDPKFYATIWKNTASGSRWAPVAQTPIYTRGGGGSGGTVPPNQIVPEATEHTLVTNVVDVGFDMGGSGGFWEHQVIDWDQGDAGPQVAYTIARGSPTVLQQFGTTVVDAPHLADGDATCCPTEREVVVIEHPNGRTSVPAVSTIVPRGEDTPELLMAEVYAAWLDGSVGSVSTARLAAQPRRYLNDNPSGGQDVYGLDQRSCPWDGTRYACRLASTGNTMTWRIEPTPAGTHQLVEIVEGSP